MNLLLVNPTISGDFNTLHLGLASICTFINKRSSHKAHIADLAFQRKHWKSYLSNRLNDIDIVAIYLSTPMLNQARKVINFLKKHNKIVIAGGHHATLCPESTIKIRGIDYVIIGEGEFIVKNLLDRLQDKKSTNISGVWYKKKGNIIRNKPATLISCLEDLPEIDWDTYNDLEKQLFFYEYLPLIGNRGCKYSCTFCSVDPIRKILSSKNNDYFREKNPKLVAQEAKRLWEKYERKGMKFVRFTDSIFTTNPKWVNEFCDEYIRLGLKGKPFSIYAIPNEFDESIAQTLSKAGCKVVRTGIESANQEILTKVHEKGTKISEIKNIVLLCKKYKMEVLGYFIYGAPGDTKSTLKQTFSFIRKMKIDIPTILIYKPLPKTKMLEKIDNSNIKINIDKMNNINNFYDVAVLDSMELTSRYVEYYQAKSYIYISVKRLIIEISYRGFSFLSEFPKYFIKGLKYNIGHKEIIRAYLSRRHIK